MGGSRVFYLQNNFVLAYRISNLELIHKHLYQYGMAINCYPEGLLSLIHYVWILRWFYVLSHLAFSLLRLMTQGHLAIIACLLVSLSLMRSHSRLGQIGLRLFDEDSSQSLVDGLTLFLELEMHRNYWRICHHHLRFSFYYHLHFD